MPLSKQEVDQIVEQMMCSTDNINDVTLQIKREGYSLTQERLALTNDLVTSGFVVNEITNLPKKETYIQYEVETVYPVQATFKFSEEALTRTPGLAEAIKSKSKVATTIQTADLQLDDAAVKAIAKLISLNKDNVIQLSATFHYGLHSSEKDPKKFIEQLKESGLTIVGEPELSYEKGSHSNTPDFNKPSSVEIKVKYDGAKPDSEISNSLKSRSNGRSAGMI